MNGSTGLEVYNTYTMSMRISFSFFLIFRIILSSPIVVLAHSQTPIKPNTELDPNLLILPSSFWRTLLNQKKICLITILVPKLYPMFQKGP